MSEKATEDNTKPQDQDKVSLTDVFNALELLEQEGFQRSKQAFKSVGLDKVLPVAHKILEPVPKDAGPFSHRLWVSENEDGTTNVSEIEEFKLNTIFSFVKPDTREGAQIWVSQSKDEVKRQVGDAVVTKGPLATGPKWVSLSISDYIASRKPD
jgi:hypothetical protein